MSPAPLVRAVTVDTSAERAFTIFTERIGDWWPLATHSPADELAADLAFVDGALVETGSDGGRSVWGEVTEWDPPRRLALTWSPSGGPVTSIVVEFEDSGDATRVVLRHEGWEAYGDAAESVREGYGGDHAWGWIMDLFALASDGAPQGRPGSSGHAPDQEEQAGEGTGYGSPALRGAFEAVARALAAGPFGEPEPGEWTVRQVAGHVTTNAELMSSVVDDVRAGRPARLHGPDDHAAAAINRFDGVDLDDAAGTLRRAGAELVARCTALTSADRTTPVSTYIEHDGHPVVDGPMTLAELLTAEVAYHLPAHASQIVDLATPRSGD